MCSQPGPCISWIKGFSCFNLFSFALHLNSLYFLNFQPGMTPEKAIERLRDGLLGLKRSLEAADNELPNAREGILRRLFYVPHPPSPLFFLPLLLLQSSSLTLSFSLSVQILLSFSFCTRLECSVMPAVENITLFWKK